MSLKSVHPEYKNMLPRWTKCRDCFEGSDVIKSKGTVYLPRLEGMSDEDYSAYKTRALFYAITSKTVSALVGMATVKKPKITYDDSMKSYFEDHSGLQFYEFWGKALSDVLLVGRVGGLVDVPSTGGEPYVSIYPTENILDWDCDSYGNYTMVKLFESYFQRDPDDEFNTVEVNQYRVLRLRNGVYTVQIYDFEENPTAEFSPTFLGSTLSYIPFYTVNPFGVGPEVVKPPMMDIVVINLSHYLSSADLEHGRHFTGLPTPVAIGVAEGTKMYIGSGTAWIIPEPTGDAKYLEFTGQGLQSLEKALTEKQSQLASLSARFIDNSSKGSENVDVVQLRFMSETASLALNVKATEAFFNAIYRTVAEMKGLSKDSFNCVMNTNLLSGKLSGTEVFKMVESYVKGGISAETLVYNLQKGEILSPDRDPKDEIKFLIESVKAQTQPQP